jgi:hypothetical protein
MSIRSIGKINNIPLYFQNQIKEIIGKSVATLTEREKTGKQFKPNFKGKFYVKVGKKPIILMGERSFFGKVNSRYKYFRNLDNEELLKKFNAIVKKKGLEKQNDTNDKIRDDLTKQVETKEIAKRREVREKRLLEIQKKLKEGKPTGLTPTQIRQIVKPPPSVTPTKKTTKSFDVVKLVSYINKQGKRNPTFDFSVERFKALGFSVGLIEGYRRHEILKVNPNYKSRFLVYENVRDKVLPVLEKTKKDGIIFGEDDAIPRNIFTPDFVDRKIKEYDGENNILWFGFQRILKKNKDSSHPRGFYVVGAQLIWMPKKLYPLIKEVMTKVKPQHYDGFLSKNMDLPIKLVDRDIQMKGRGKALLKTRYVNELESASLTIGVRSGIPLQDISKY